ncbi:hypothetical protein JX265_008225 [Neoarthrinium moseri]|uniref:Uncharacterized protein n=1 Tax=Neoarthrinium moseri TaxID=1658444 RepID=A0A9P9WIF3_9PEZI|nr:hypothetical protein JX265_008225 [Neoarthrinium moseri]
MPQPPGSRVRKPRANRQDIEIKVVEPTPETQDSYNRIREDEARRLQRLSPHQDTTQQELGTRPCSSYRSPNSQDLLRPPEVGTQSLVRRRSKSESCARSISSPSSTTDQPAEQNDTHDPDAASISGRRLRGRRGGPLKPEIRLMTAIKRKLGLVCERCKSKKVTCIHYDLSKLELGYRATRRTSHAHADDIDLPTSNPQASDNSLSAVSTDLFVGINGNNNGFPSPVPVDEDDFGDFAGQTQNPSARQDVRNLVDSFDVTSVTLGLGTMPIPFGRSYNPGLGSSGPLQTPSEPFPIGSEVPSDRSQWRCEYTAPRQPGSDFPPSRCAWTGPLHDLQVHFTAQHHGFQDEMYWCECMPCSTLTAGWEPPPQCIQENCFGGQWRRWFYGENIAESTIVSTPALTQSGESESGYSYDARGSGDQLPFAGNNSMGFWGSYPGGGGSSSGFHSQQFKRGGTSDGTDGVDESQLYNERAPTILSRSLLDKARCLGLSFAVVIGRGVWVSSYSAVEIPSILRRSRPSPWEKARLSAQNHPRE